MKISGFTTQLLRNLFGRDGAGNQAVWWLTTGIALFLTSAQLQAQSYAINWSTIDGGGGAGTGGVYTLTGTIGQPDAAMMSGGNFTLDGGFWGAWAAIQTPGSPYLRVALTPTNTVMVWWAMSKTNWRLQVTTNLVSTGCVWTECAYQTNVTTCWRVESPPTGHRFYRLQTP